MYDCYVNHNIHDLIGLYCYLCEIYDSRLYVNVQRLSNNSRPQFTDVEVLTVYLWGLKERLFEVKAIYNFTKTYLLDCFPQLPSYAAFSRRLGELHPALLQLVEELALAEDSHEAYPLCLLDSMPIVVAHTRQRTAPRTAHGLCAVGYNATKNMHYYGVKLSVLGQKREGKTPLPRMFGLCPANESDITIGKELLANASNISVFADRGYISQPWQEQLAFKGIDLHTPAKRQRNSPPLSFLQEEQSRQLSSIRQPIEGLFSLFQNHFYLDVASKIRSVKGLLAFIWGRIAAALFHILRWFNY